ncbi:unannotated protein [freshwater metagenome]|uniref:Unannotated protein n=1 Tax=freshwater metagenome TaxID=449393 RepID=A0A6J6ERI9_9ZZZZ
MPTNMTAPATGAANRLAGSANALGQPNTATDTGKTPSWAARVGATQSAILRRRPHAPRRSR